MPSWSQTNHRGTTWGWPPGCTVPTCTRGTSRKARRASGRSMASAVAERHKVGKPLQGDPNVGLDRDAVEGRLRRAGQLLDQRQRLGERAARGEDGTSLL